MPEENNQTKNHPTFSDGACRTSTDSQQGAQSGWKPRHRRARHEAAPLDHSLNVSDITAGGFRTRRATNPLTPSYRVNGMDVADDPEKSRPRALPKAKDGPFYPLTTADIEGAAPGWRPLPQVNPPLEARRHFRNTNFMGDIPGAQADTVKHSICTERHVNPLNPVYTSLDGEPLANPQTPLYKEPACVEAEAQLDRTIASEKRANAERAASAEGSSAPAAATAAAPAEPSDSASNGQEAGSIGGQEEKHRQQQQQWQQQEPWEASVKQRPSSEPLQSARSGITGSSRCGSGGQRVRQFAGTGPNNNVDQRDPAANRAMSAVRGGSGAASGRGTGNSNNEKDERIRLLENEVRWLRKRGGEAWQHKRPAAPGTGTGVITPPTGDNNRRISSGGGGSGGGGSGGGGGGRSTARSCPGSDRQSGASGGGGAMVLRSRGDHGSQQTERLVLRSANGTPRVPLTPSERRSAREYHDDVASVRDLQ